MATRSVRVIKAPKMPMPKAGASIPKAPKLPQLASNLSKYAAKPFLPKTAKGM